MIVSKPVITRVEEPKKIGGPLKKVQKQMKPVVEKDIKPLTDNEVKKIKVDAELAGTTTKMTWTVMDRTGTVCFPPALAILMQANPTNMSFTGNILLHLPPH